MKTSLLTERQYAVLKFINAYQKDHGFSPTMREIANGVGLRSHTSADYHVRRLAASGYLRRQDGTARGITLA